MENTTVIFKVDFGDTAQKAVDLTNKIKSLGEQLENARNEFGDNSKETKVLEAALKANRAQLAEYNKTLENGVKIQEQQQDSLKALKLRLTEQRKAYSELSKAERENVDIGVKQAKNIRELQQEIKDLELGLGNTAVNVGNYQDAVEKAFDNKITGSIRDLKDSLGGAIGAFKGMGQAGKDAGGGIAGIGASVKVGFGAVLIIIQVLIGLFQSLSENFEPLRIALAEVQAIGKALFATFTEGLYAIVEAIKSPSKALEIFGNFADEAGERIGNAAKNAGELERQTIAIEKAQRKVNVAVSLLTAESEKQEKIADNQAVSFADRQLAIQKALKAEQEKGKLLLDLERKKLAVVEGRLTIEPRSKELLNEQAALTISINEILGQQVSKIQDLQNKYAELNRSRKDQELSVLETAKNGQLEATTNVAKQYQIRLELLKIAKQKELNAESISAEDRKRIEADFLVKKQSLRRQYTTQALSEALEASVLEIETALKKTKEGSEEELKLKQELIDRQLKADLNAINKEVISNDLKIAKIKLAEANAVKDREDLQKNYQDKIKQQNDEAAKQSKEAKDKELEKEKVILDSKSRAKKLQLELDTQDELLSLTERTNAKIKLIELEREQLLEQENITAEERAAINRKYDKEIAKEREAINKSSAQTTLEQAAQIANGLIGIFELAKQTELNIAGDNAEKRAAIEKKYAERVRTIKMFEIVASTAAAIVKTLGDPTLLFPANVITAGIIGATGAAQLAVVATQKFAGGGYTGSGYGSPDETGYKPAGIVHEGEYVVPKRVVNSNPALMATLEGKRLGKYADGGLVSNSISSGAQAFNYDKLAQSIAKIRVVTEVQAFETAQTDRRTIINQATY